MTQAMLNSTSSAATLVNDDTISTESGTGTGGRDRILDSASGLGAFGVHDFVTFMSGDANNGITVKALSVAAGAIEVAAGSLTAVAAGNPIALVKFDIAGSIASILRNGTLRVFRELRPASADDPEPGSVALEITLNGDAFTAGASENGLNLAALDGNTMKRMIDPDTAATEVWRGIVSLAGIAQSARFYANDVVTGSSTSSKRIDFAVGTDFVLSNSNLEVGLPVEVTDVSFNQNAC
jgi:hypothetical protein